MCKITEGIQEDINKLGDIILDTLRENKGLRQQQDFLSMDMGVTGSIVYVTDLLSNEILFVNDEATKHFGPDLIGQSCFNVFHDFSDPCDFCNNDIIKEHIGKPHQWVHFNTKLKQLFLIFDVAREIQGKLLRFERATPIERDNLAQIYTAIDKHNLL